MTILFITLVIMMMMIIITVLSFIIIIITIMIMMMIMTCDQDDHCCDCYSGHYMSLQGIMIRITIGGEEGGGGQP